jgi:hypothetical protein
MVFAGCLLGTLLQAQEYLYEIGGMGGGASYMGDANKTAPLKGLNPAAGVVFRYNANFRIALKADLAWASISGSTEGLENVFPERAQASFERNVFEMGGQFEFNFFPYSDKYAYLNTKRFSPYLLVGLGATVAPGNGSTFAGLNLPVGIGVKYKLKNRLNLGCELSVRKLFGDGLDVTDERNRILDNPYGIGSSVWKNQDWYTLLTFSVTWDFGLRNCLCNSKDGLLF